MDPRIDYESKLKEIIIDKLDLFWKLCKSQWEIIPTHEEKPQDLFEKQLGVESFRDRDVIAGALVESLSRSLGNFVEESFSSYYEYRRELIGKIGEIVRSYIPGLVDHFRDRLKGEEIREESFERFRKNLVNDFKKEGNRFYRHVKESYESLVEKIAEESNKLRGYLCIYEALCKLEKYWGNWMSFENIYIGNGKSIQELFCDLIGNGISFISIIDDFDPFNLPDIPLISEKGFWPSFREKYIENSEYAIKDLIKKICSYPPLKNKGGILHNYISKFFNEIEKLKDKEFLSSTFLEDLFNQLIVQHGILEYEIFYRVVKMENLCVPKVAFFEETEREKREVGELDLLVLKDHPMYLGIEVTTRGKFNEEKEVALNSVKELMQKKGLKLDIKIIKSKEELDKLTLSG